MRMTNLCIAAIAAFLFSLAAASAATKDNHYYNPTNEVDVELVLAVDISQSMGDDEQEVQRAGYVAALTSRDFLDAIEVGPIGRVAVIYMEWGSTGEHFIVADWTVIQNESSAAHFASKIAEAPLRQVQRTSISSALKKSVNLLENNQYEGLRQVIDISGDGPNNQGDPVTDTRDFVVAKGITINGLPLMMKSNKNTWQALLELDHYYEDCVIGGPGSFAIPVRAKEHFADAIRMKLVMEIADLQMPESEMYPEPLVRPVMSIVSSGIRALNVMKREPIRCNLFD